MKAVFFLKPPAEAFAVYPYELMSLWNNFKDVVEYSYSKKHNSIGFNLSCRSNDINLKEIFYEDIAKIYG